MNRVPFRNQLDSTLYVRPAKDHLLTSESPFLGCFEVPPQSVTWLWLEVRFETAGARLDTDGSVLVETSGPMSDKVG
jgi:hypothetical protein